MCLGTKDHWGFCDRGASIPAMWPKTRKRIETNPLSLAMIAFIGRPGHLDSVSPEERVAARIGTDAALTFVPRVRAILDDLYGATPPLYNAGSVREVGDTARAWLRAHHPELGDEAINAAVNDFAFQWK
ncbi:hypothetical protein SAMN05444157_3597 [Frankineae bacterium MT45]|nr:hypothetical protein SAMN05444157_3597 [Frankineae bacterium MT45]